MKKTATELESLSIFFPFYNDSGTVMKAISLAYKVGRKLTKDLEVIALHGGASKDKTAEMIVLAYQQWPDLKIIDAEHNREGYAVIKRGLAAATKKWVFYTDGDLQYDVHELRSLVKAQVETQADVVNGYKTYRADNPIRYFCGEFWRRLSRALYKLPISDVDCDFRLIRNQCLKQCHLKSSGAAILEELVLKLEAAGAIFAEIPVTHYAREYGHSNYFFGQLILEKIKTLRMLWEVRVKL